MAGGGNNVARMSPRQRMINLMYIVLTAMLALNVSSDVLNGFSQVQSSLHKTNDNLSTKNDIQFDYLAMLNEKNPVKAGPWYEKGVMLHDRTDKIYSLIETIKTDIAVKADGKGADYTNIDNLEDLDAAPAVLLDPTTKRGEKLREAIDDYRTYVSALIPDTTRRDIVIDMLSTSGSNTPGTIGETKWEEKLFDNMPAIAAVTLLTKIQNDIRQAESEALSHLITNVDIGDVRVNELNAYVLPNSNMVMRGGKYSAQIVLAAIDTTMRPDIYINGERLSNPNGIYEFTAGQVGPHEYSGYLEVKKGDGTIERHDFSSQYNVIEPMATISPTMMNVLYAGIDNPISISVPGTPMHALSATMTNGTLTRSGDQWIARPTKVGDNAVISVTANNDGHSQSVGSMTFRIRKLPDPTAYIAMKDASGNPVSYKGSPKRISKAALMAADGIQASVDDGILDIAFTVVSFSTVFYDSMGNAIPEVSDGNKFSSRQKEQFRRLKNGKSFFISNIKAKGPDGITRDISPMEVAVN